ncbi:anti-sigma factor domain-containing protein [Leptolyngbya sp. AN03gr2]|uniref:anti-sigma factor domain-containing protein n=1 Tax=unclassified Leptolyngbya TaxID=2650499 RepID=UPI003D31B750
MTRSNDDTNPIDLAAGYILDDLSPEEVDRLNQARKDPAIAQEIATFQEAFALLPYDTPMLEPSPRLKQKILSAAIQSAAQQPNVVPLARRNWRRWIPAISTGIAAVAVAALGFSQFAQQSQQTIALQRQLEATNTEIARLRDELQTNQATIARLSQPDTQVYSLVSATSNRATARVLSNKRDRTVTLVAQDLPKLPKNQIYRLWAVATPAAAPTYCGEFRQDDTGKAQWIAPNVACTKNPSRLLITLDAPSDPITSAGPLVMKSST